MKKVIPCNNCIYLGKERSDESAKIHGQIYHCEYWDSSKVDEEDGCTKGAIFYAPYQKGGKE